MSDLDNSDLFVDTNAYRSINETVIHSLDFNEKFIQSSQQYSNYYLICSARSIPNPTSDFSRTSSVSLADKVVLG